MIEAESKLKGPCSGPRAMTAIPAEYQQDPRTWLTTALLLQKSTDRQDRRCPGSLTVHPPADCYTMHPATQPPFHGYTLLATQACTSVGAQPG